MSSLYEISEDYAELFDKYEEIANYDFNTDADGNCVDDFGNIIENPEGYKASMLQAWFDTLEGIEGEFELKAENMAVFIKNLKAEVFMLEAEEKKLKQRRIRKSIQVSGIEVRLKYFMERVNIKKLDLPKAKINIRNNAESTVIDNAKDFIKWAETNNKGLLKYSEPEIRKTETKKLIQSGKVLPGVHLERSQSLIIT